MKRLLAIFLTVLMLVSAMPLTALAATTETAQTATVTLELSGIDNTCTEQQFRKLLANKINDTGSNASAFYGETLDPKGYYYTHLTSNFQRQVYNACYNYISPTSLTTSISFDDLDGYVYGSDACENAASRIVQNLWVGMWSYRYDNVYDCDSYTYETKYTSFTVDYNTNTGVITKAYLTFGMDNHPSYSASHITTRNQRIATIAQIASKEKTTYAKLKAIYDEIIKTSQYDHSDAALKSEYFKTSTFYYAHSSLGILNNGLGVCESYSKAFKLVCDYMDLAPCIVLTSETHMWNVIYLNGQWYGLDATWDDPGAGTGVYYTYFLSIDPDIIDGSSTDHVPDGKYTIAPDYADTKYTPCSSGDHTLVTVPGTPATCTSTGTTDRVYCSECGETITPATTIPKKDHIRVTVPGTPATCTSTGRTDGVYCSTCGTTLTASTTIPKKAHTTTFVSRVAPTYYTTGTEAHYRCTACGGLFLDAAGTYQVTPESLVIPVLDMDEMCDHHDCIDVPGMPATTEQSGLTAGVYCNLCQMFIVEQVVIPQIDTIVPAKPSYTYTGKIIKPGVVVTDETGTVIDSSNYTLSYSSGCKLPGTYTITIKFKGDYSGTHKVTYKIVIPAPLPKASSSTSAIKLSWGKVSGASGYIIYDGAKKKLKDNKTATSYTISKRKAGTSYSYYVRTYKKIGSKTYYSDYVKITTTTLPANTTVSASSSASAIKLTWKKVTGATGYMVYNSSKTLLKDCGNTLTNTFTGLKAGTSYTYYVRAYRTVGGKKYYSGYTKVSMSTKPAAPTVKFTSTTTTAKLSWGKVTGASGYMVYNSSKKLLKDNKTATSYSISKLKAGTSYTYYVRTYRKALGKTFYSDYIKVTIATLPAAPKITSTTSNSTEIKIVWSKVSGASGYEFYNSDKSFLWEGDSSYTSLRIYDCMVGTQYTHYMRAYKTVGGKRIYSSYVKITYATKPTFNDSNVTVNIGKTYKLSLNTTASSVTWKSSDTTIATVSSSGVVTGKKAGTVTITATANGQKATITIKVVKMSNYAILKNHIIETGYTDSDGDKYIGFKEVSGTTEYYTIITYNYSKGCLEFMQLAEGSSDAIMTFDYYENQSSISVEMEIYVTSSTYAEIEYDLDVKSYYSGKGFTYYITAHGLLDYTDYRDLVSSFTKVGFTSWNLLLKSELGFGLKDIGFTSYY